MISLDKLLMEIDSYLKEVDNKISQINLNDKLKENIKDDLIYYLIDLKEVLVQVYSLFKSMDSELGEVHSSLIYEILEDNDIEFDVDMLKTVGLELAYLTN